MRVQPVQPTVSFKMRMNNAEQERKNKVMTNPADPSFKEVLKETEQQIITPSFKGHWPNYYKLPNESTEVTNNVTGPTIPTVDTKLTNRLNFVV